MSTKPVEIWVITKSGKPVAAYSTEIDARVFVRQNKSRTKASYEVTPVSWVQHPGWGMTKEGQRVVAEVDKEMKSKLE